ncbi:MULTISPECIES: hypothetical protein [Bacillus cereus group]|uniref:hypothetical protein n=1 Tax=Bacillus cereus group TaxID=86661 RepID=UPI0006A90000|nr:hypothetical protein [Bacillus tropicus]MCU5224195.1 hypothetical protein [Bacillus tropicus]CUB50604.1 hypothetical protein BN2127_JRS10_00115 [Bacillus subtilis]
MPELKVGLAPNKTSYFDPIKNLYITLANPVQSVHFTDHKELSNICHALCASVPALVLYEGKLPQEAIDAWEAKYKKPFNTDMSKTVRGLDGNMVAAAKEANRAFDRPEKVNKKSADNSKKEVTEEKAGEEKAPEDSKEEIKTASVEEEPKAAPKSKTRKAKATEEE